MPRVKSFADVPSASLARMGVKLNLLGALAWDYADTVLDLAAQMRISQTRPLSRAVRALRLDYDRMRARSLDTEHMRGEWRLAEQFEAICKSHFRRLALSLRNEINSLPGLDPRYVMLIEAVQMAMTLIDTMRLYAAKCDAFIRRYYPQAPHSILSDHFLSLAALLPQFAGDAYTPASPSRKASSRILLNEINAIDLYDDD